jgi:hypothetical protein
MQGSARDAARGSHYHEAMSVNAGESPNAAVAASPAPAVAKQQVLDALAAVLAPANLLFQREQTAPFECDGLAVRGGSA